MFVNDVYKFTFVHIMKTGGNSMMDYLGKIPNTYKFNPKQGRNAHGHDSIGNMPKNLVGNDYFKFATVRDPRSWYMSLYYRAQERSGGNEELIFGSVRQLSMEEWVNRAINPKEWMAKNDVWTSDIADWIDRDTIINSKLDVGWFTFRNLFQLSSCYKKVFETYDNNDLSIKFNEIIGVDCLLKQEFLNETIRPVLTNIGIPQHELSHPLPIRNKTTNYGNDIWDHYTLELSDAVRAKDFVWYENLYIKNEQKVWYNNER